MDHDLIRAALRVLRSTADHESAVAEDLELLRSRLPDLDPDARPDDIACQVIQAELDNRRKAAVLTATA